MKFAAALLTKPGQRRFRPDPIHHRVDLVGVADVADMMRGGDVDALGDFRGGLFQHLRAAPADVNFRALGGERLANFEAEAAASAGHEDRLPS